MAAGRNVDADESKLTHRDNLYRRSIDGCRPAGEVELMQDELLGDRRADVDLDAVRPPIKTLYFERARSERLLPLL